MKKIEKIESLSFKPPLFHKFSFLNRFFVFFPITGSLIEVDKDFYFNLNENSLIDEPFLNEEKKIWEKYDVKFNPPKYLKSLCLLISQTCNMKCDYCFVNDGTFGDNESLMDENVSLKAVDFLIENSKTKHIEIDFFGGEPLINWKVVRKTIEYGGKRSKEYGKILRFSLTTNGVLLDEEKLNFLKENFVSLIISLDGPPEVNNLHRKMKNGSNSFDYVYKNIKNLKNYEGYYIRGTFTNKTKDIFENAKFFYENGFKNISLEPVILDKENPLSLKKEDLKELKKEYEKLGEYIYNEKLKGNKLNFYHFNIDLSNGPCLGKMNFGCGAGVEYLAVDTKGDIYPCHFLKEFKEFKVGNIFDGIDENKKNYFMYLNDINSKEKCKSCWAKYLCGGGCIAHSYFINSDPLKMPDDFCEIQKKRIEIGLLINSL
ncbi:MAG: SPASM domain-containing protein [Caldisericia bacterium]|nr:SPASM domain-containing protein [Caldisericia bacterium]